MAQKKPLKFQNRAVCRLPRKNDDGFPPLRLKKLALLCALTSALCFSGLKALWFFRLPPFSSKSVFSSKASFSWTAKKPEKTAQKNHSFPVLVNLQAEGGGPKPTRVQVHISLQSYADERDFLSLGDTFQTHFSFILSGRSAKDLNNRKERFERQILSQLNTFLPHDPVKKVKIQTGAFN